MRPPRQYTETTRGLAMSVVFGVTLFVASALASAYLIEARGSLAAFASLTAAGMALVLSLVDRWEHQSPLIEWAKIAQAQLIFGVAAGTGSTLTDARWPMWAAAAVAIVFALVRGPLHRTDLRQVLRVQHADARGSDAGQVEGGPDVTEHINFDVAALAIGGDRALWRVVSGAHLAKMQAVAGSWLRFLHRFTPPVASGLPVTSGSEPPVPARAARGPCVPG